MPQAVELNFETPNKSFLKIALVDRLMDKTMTFVMTWPHRRADGRVPDKVGLGAAMGEVALRKRP